MLCLLLKVVRESCYLDEALNLFRPLHRLLHTVGRVYLRQLLGAGAGDAAGADRGRVAGPCARVLRLVPGRRLPLLLPRGGYQPLARSCCSPRLLSAPPRVHHDPFHGLEPRLQST